MTPVDGAPGLPAPFTSAAQFVPVVALVLPVLVPLVMPPPVHPTILIVVLVTGFTRTLLVMIGKPGVNVCVPLSDLHFGNTVFAAPAGPAAIAVTETTSESASSTPPTFRISNSLL